MLRDSSRHLVVGSALAFVGSVLAGTVVGLPAALAQSGLGQTEQPQTRLTGTLTRQDVALVALPVVAGDTGFAVNGLTQGTSIRIAPVLPAGTAPLPGVGITTPDPAASGALGIPAPVLDAYKRAADTKNRLTPSCQIDWPLLAAVGKVESDHAAGGKVDTAGRTRGEIIGVQTRHGTAKGPMQFLDSSWGLYGADGNGDGAKDVHNIYDAALAAANHLCGSAGNRSLQDPGNLRQAIFGYNRADWYVTKVINWMNQYSGRAVAVPPSEGVIETRPVTPVLPVEASIPEVPEPAPAPTESPVPTETPSPTPTEIQDLEAKVTDRPTGTAPPTTPTAEPTTESTTQTPTSTPTG